MTLRICSHPSYHNECDLCAQRRREGEKEDDK